MRNPPELVDERERRAIQDALASGRQRDRLLEILLDVRDAKGGIGISKSGLMFLAEQLRLYPAEVYEVATTYPSTKFVSPTPAVEKAATDLDSEWRVAPAKSASFFGGLVDGSNGSTPPRSLADYRESGGYEILHILKSDPTAADDLMQKVAALNLKGRAGAGFPVARKWKQAKRSAGTPVVVVNGNEGELGVFKDRFILENEPHAIIEAALVVAHVTGADHVFIYLQDEYKFAQSIFAKAVAETMQAGLAETVTLDLRRSGGAYICGEETTLIASLEGRAGRPTERPPYPSEMGYKGRPTIVHNVETFFRLRRAWGAQSDVEIPVSRLLDPNTSLFSVTGRVRNPGPKLMSNLLRLVDLLDLAGGLSRGVELGGMVVGGSCGTLISAVDCERPLPDLVQNGLTLGTGGVFVFSSKDDRRAIAFEMAAFAARESCGKCGPCRIGSKKAMETLVSNGPLDTVLIDELSTVMAEASLCGLGRNAGRFLKTLPSYFGDPQP
ncbi:MULTISPECIES: NADH-ubiquinone oxidoreductase-F iron-sulfur binding region domain-containing protein [unclassified Sulfitobacter]|uniref:NADH-ubiquinone oxidoreductase-F iron-sulfur binding region domain-containing protein n=1 Tax=unclassified Sulfitobacter TaxID=196795 RepID=UPI00374695E1